MLEYDIQQLNFELSSPNALVLKSLVLETAGTLDHVPPLLELGSQGFIQLHRSDPPSETGLYLDVEFDGGLFEDGDAG